MSYDPILDMLAHLVDDIADLRADIRQLQKNVRAITDYLLKFPPPENDNT